MLRIGYDLAESGTEAPADPIRRGTQTSGGRLSHLVSDLSRKMIAAFFALSYAAAWVLGRTFEQAVTPGTFGPDFLSFRYRTDVGLSWLAVLRSGMVYAAWSLATSGRRDRERLFSDQPSWNTWEGLYF